MMNRFYLLFVTFLIFSAMTLESASPRRTRAKKPETSTSIRKKRSETTKAIRSTSKKIEMNRQEINRKLNDLNRITADIAGYDKEIAAINKQLKHFDGQINRVSDTIGILDDRLSSMSAKYASAIRRVATRNRNATTDLAFIFSANSAAEAYRRNRSLEQFSKWRKRKADELGKMRDELDNRRKHLETLKNERASVLASLNEVVASLSHKKEESDKLVAGLRRQDSKLKSFLASKQKEAAALDAELNRLIALEEKKAREEEARRRKAELAEKKPGKSNEPRKETKTQEPVKAKAEKSHAAKKTEPVGGEFAMNRGRIPSPVAGSYKIVKRFGRQKHPDLKYVETDNPGIDIETSPGAAVQSVFDGRVSDIFRLPGYNNVVMIRHGHYLTIYANLATINIKKGDSVKAGQKIGTVFSDPDDDGRSILHFEIRNEKLKEDPEKWLAML